MFSRDSGWILIGTAAAVGLVVAFAPDRIDPTPTPPPTVTITVNATTNPLDNVPPPADRDNPDPLIRWCMDRWLSVDDPTGESDRQYDACVSPLLTDEE